MASIIDRENDHYLWTDDSGVVHREKPDQYLWTDADGLVSNIRLPNRARILGIGIGTGTGTGSSRAEVRQALGQPHEQHTTRAQYTREGRIIHVQFIEDVVTGIALRMTDPPPRETSS